MSEQPKIPSMLELIKQRQGEEAEQERKRQQHQQQALAEHLQSETAKAVESFHDGIISDKAKPKKRFNYYSTSLLVINLLCCTMVWLDFMYQLLPMYAPVGLVVASMFCFVLQLMTRRDGD